ASSTIPSTAILSIPSTAASSEISTTTASSTASTLASLSSMANSHTHGSMKDAIASIPRPPQHHGGIDSHKKARVVPTQAPHTVPSDTYHNDFMSNWRVNANMPARILRHDDLKSPVANADSKTRANSASQGDEPLAQMTNSAVDLWVLCMGQSLITRLYY